MQELMDNFKPLQSSFDQLVYNIGNFSSEVDISYITKNGAKADKSKAVLIFSTAIFLNSFDLAMESVVYTAYFHVIKNDKNVLTRGSFQSENNIMTMWKEDFDAIFLIICLFHIIHICILNYVKQESPPA